ncbi:MAG: hypothetical protein JRF02_09220 [Deltaproteobacteria bacterium]|jgi:hypothetical protein|nr:hypothetical protein [Deltaproteobacteria bacterium]
MKSITVECYAGSRPEEYPLNFYLSGEKINISKIIDRWITPEDRCFKVLGNDSNVYLLKYNANKDSWRILLKEKR